MQSRLEPDSAYITFKLNLPFELVHTYVSGSRSDGDELAALLCPGVAVVGAEVQADCIQIVYPGVCPRCVL